MFEQFHLLTTIYFISEWVVRLVMLFWVPTKRSPEAAKGWLLFIFFLPWPGLLLYALIGRPYAPRSRQERLDKAHKALQPTGRRLLAHPNVFHPKLTPELDGTVDLAEKISRLPILGGNDVVFLPQYEASIERLAADIDTAHDHVHLLYYIFRADAATEPVVAALERAAKRGVACRVLVDALGSRTMLGPLFARLQQAGVECQVSMPAKPLRFWLGRTDLRNHRKIAVIDGRIGYTGSQNLIAADFKEGITNVEMVVRVEGPITVALQYVFVGDWYLESDVLLDEPRYFPDPTTPNDKVAQLLPSGPMYAAEGNQLLLVSMFHDARKRIIIVTPYFIPDEPLFEALEIAVLRGVQVDLIVSQQEDQFLVSRAQQSYYEDLLDVGVRIHRFHGGFLHAKFVTVDDEIGFVGSSNLDIRSFVLNAEISLLLYDRSSAGFLRDEQLRYIKNSNTLTAEEWAKRTWVAKLTQNIARLLSPLL